MPIAYSVYASLSDPDTRDEYIAWLRGGHVEAVVAAGASEARIVAVEDPGSPIQVQVHYIFPDRPSLDRYLRDHAPRLRAEGVARFPASRGIALRREVGVIL